MRQKLRGLARLLRGLGAWRRLLGEIERGGGRGHLGLRNGLGSVGLGQDHLGGLGGRMDYRLLDELLHLGGQYLRLRLRLRLWLALDLTEEQRFLLRQ